MYDTACKNYKYVNNNLLLLLAMEKMNFTENSLYFIAIALLRPVIFFLLLLVPFDIAKIAKLQCFCSHKLGIYINVIALRHLCKYFIIIFL